MVLHKGTGACPGERSAKREQPVYPSTSDGTDDLFNSWKKNTESQNNSASIVVQEGSIVHLPCRVTHVGDAVRTVIVDLIQSENAVIVDLIQSENPVFVDLIQSENSVIVDLIQSENPVIVDLIQSENPVIVDLIQSENPVIVDLIQSENPVIVDSTSFSLKIQL
ncbi:unnamed protein product [Cyprideis torosa]|uniref:Uncharacterized protein n=1 Tax=Cyprideis torosa TaxID=163714 RepID=A0A7R8W3C2_9CRUS|nr:unnamed protein product [Cyprideis torosa]CAG0882853.1 unnamed protein product [Cyprideis torosa]